MKVRKEAGAVVARIAVGVVMLCSVAIKVAEGVPRSPILPSETGKWVQLGVLGVEGAVACVLAFAARTRGACWLGLIACVTFMAVHLGQLAGELETCGCFGRIRIPAWAGLAFAVVGAAGCVKGLGRRGCGTRDGGGRRLWVMAVAMLGGSGSFLAGVMMYDAAAQAVARVAGRMGYSNPTMLLVVGARACAKCERVLRRINSMGMSKMVILLVNGDAEANEGSLGRVPVVGVPATDWWAMVKGDPPSIWCLEGGVPTLLQSDAEVAGCGK